MAAQIENILIYLPLEGMESEHCAAIIDKELSQIYSIKSHKVELNNNRAILSLNELHAIPEIIQSIKNIGYGVTTVKQTFPVLGMNCASCAGSAENGVKDLPGVIFASVNYATANLSIEYLPTMLNPILIQKAVQSVGYDLLIEDEAKQQITLESIHEKKYKALKFKATWAVILAFPVMVIGMFFMDMPFANYIMFALSTPVVFWLGKDFFINAFKQAKHRSANMDTLVALSTGIAYAFSVFNMFFPDFWHSRGLHAHVYFEAAAVIIAFILLGRLLEENAKGNTSSAIKKLMGLQPKKVTVISADNFEKQIGVDEVVIGDTVLVKPGEKIAVDGIVLSGESYVDESMLSGETSPVLKTNGKKVFAGTINHKGSFKFKALKVGKDTMLAQIIKTVQDAQGSKAPVQNLVDKVAAVFVPVVMAIALLAVLLWFLIGGESGLVHGILAAVTVLVIACPCALGLATPTAIMVGVGKAASKGILIKDAKSLEFSKKINAIILDKTGTITECKMQVVNEVWQTENEIAKAILVSIEKQSEHPIAEAILRYYANTEPKNISSFESITGKGAKAVYENENYFVGNRSMLIENKISIPLNFETLAESWMQQAKTVIWFANSQKALAVIAISDSVKGGSIEAIKQLKLMNVEVYMLTGDNKATAKQIALETNIEHYQAEVLPQQKADFVKELQKKGKVVAMVGDGINDSTAMALANVSIAMGKGSDIAMDVANMTIISSDLLKIPQAIELSKQTVATIKQNLFWAFIYNIVGIPIAAGLLYPINGFLLNPMIAGAAMALSSVSVVTNSLRLKWKK